VDYLVAREFIENVWESDIIPALSEYIGIPALSPDFDKNWEEHGHIDRGMDLIAGWCRDHGPTDLQLEVLRIPGRTPLLYMELPGPPEATTLLYGHMDKQPEMTGWRADLGPWKPVREGDRLYGRGGADDGYAAFASLTAVRALCEQGIVPGRCVILIEGSEESGSVDLPAYIERYADRIGTPGLVICLDSGAGTYDRLWTTNSLRGVVAGVLTVEVLSEGVHSGAASGIVPSSFRIARTLLSRLEDEKTGDILLPELHVEVPPDRVREAEATVGILGEAVITDFPFLDGVRPMGEDTTQLTLNQTWRPTLSVVGAGGFPPVESAGNVLRPVTKLKLSLRTPPGVDTARATELVKKVLEQDPPYGARVRFESEQSGDGWAAPATAPWLQASLDRASEEAFGRSAAAMGEGGSIPFMSMLGLRFPEAQFVITGVLGPGSNAHGPNEFLHVPMAKGVTACAAGVLADFRAAALG